MKRLIKIASSTALLTFVRMMCGFIVSKVVAVSIGPTGVAIIGQLQSVTTCVSSFASAPCSTGVVKFTAEAGKNTEASSGWWRAATAISFVLSIIIASILCIFSKRLSALLLLDEKYSWVFILIAAIIPVSNLGSMVNSIVNGWQEFRLYFKVALVNVILSCVITVSLVVLLQMEGALIAICLQVCLLGFCYLPILLVRKEFHVSSFIGFTSKHCMRAMVRYSIMAIVGSITFPITIIIVRDFINHSAGLEVVGLWQAVWKVSELYLGVISVTLATYYLPKLSSLKSHRAVINEVKKSFTFLFPLISIIAVAVYFSRSWILVILYSSSFSSAESFFGIQLLSDVVRVSAWLFSYVLVARGFALTFSCIEIIFSILLIIFSYLFINTSGAIGANYAFLLSNCIYFVLVVSCVNRVGSSHV